jgi:enoyl-CoA hydratase/carnithine racemase
VPVSVERDGRVMTARLHNPPGNRLDRRMVAELDQLTRALERDRSIGAVVITGGERGSFVASYDVAEMLAGAELTPQLPPMLVAGTLRAVGAMMRVPGGSAVLSRTRAEGLVTLRRLHEVYLRMNAMDKVFVAAINGVAAAAGCELALACDVRLMADGEFGIGLPEPALGFNPGGGGAQRLTRAVGPARAVELLLEARMCSPREAEEIGLVNRVVAPERLLDEAHATAARLARRSPHSIWAVKRAAYRGFSRPWPKGLELDATGFVAAAPAAAVKDAMRAFVAQAEELGPEAGSPFADRDTLRAWQDGTVTDLTA